MAKSKKPKPESFRKLLKKKSYFNQAHCHAPETAHIIKGILHRTFKDVKIGFRLRCLSTYGKWIYVELSGLQTDSCTLAIHWALLSSSFLSRPKQQTWRHISKGEHIKALIISKGKKTLFFLPWLNVSTTLKIVYIRYGRPHLIY